MKTINKVLWKSASCKRKHWILNETLNNLIVLIKYYLFAKSFWIKLSVQMFVLYFSYFRFLNHKDNSGSLGRSEKAIRKYFVYLKFANKHLLSQALNTALQEWNIVRRTAWKPQTPQGRTFLENIQPNSLRSSWAAPEIKFRESHETIIILCHVWQVDRKGSKVNHQAEKPRKFPNLLKNFLKALKVKVQFMKNHFNRLKSSCSSFDSPQKFFHLAFPEQT